jgi:hypothetical protein
MVGVREGGCATGQVVMVLQGQEEVSRLVCDGE